MSIALCLTFILSLQKKMSTSVPSELDMLNFKSCSPACSLADLNPAFADKLVLAQHYAGFQFTITSAFRSQEYELKHGRKGTSSHCRALAVDISAVDSHTRYKVVMACHMAGICRSGIGEKFVHVDDDETKPHPIMFTYYSPQNT